MEMIKTQGFQIDFFPKRLNIRFAPVLYGRISLTKKNGVKYYYYVPGILDNIPYFKIDKNRIFVQSTENIDFKLFETYCNNYDVINCEKSDSDIFMKTGKEVIKFKSKDRGIIVNGFWNS